jgi:uncharacterized membrane protein
MTAPINISRESVHSQDPQSTVQPVLTKLWPFFAVLFFGTFYAFLTPPLQVPDEFNHLTRIYSISRGECRSQEFTAIPRSADDLRILYPPYLEHAVKFEQLSHLVQVPLNANSRVLSTGISASLYSCLPYLPAAIALRGSGEMGFSPLALLYICRLTNLLAFSLMIFTACRWLPAYSLVILALALMPMTLHQAASLSADGMTIGTAFLLTAYIARLALDDRVTRIGTRNYVGAAFLLMFSALCKLNVGLAFLVALIPLRKFHSRLERWAAVAGALLLTLATAITWQYANRASFERIVAWRAQNGIMIEQNIAHIWGHPLTFLATFAETLMANWHFYLTSFVGMFGWQAVPLPEYLIWAYFFLLIGLALTQSGGLRMTGRQRFVLVAATTANVVSLFVIQASFDHFDRHRIYAIAGRYFIPYALAALLALNYRRFRLPLLGKTAAVVGVIGFIACMNATAYVAIWQKWYVQQPRVSKPAKLAVYRKGLWVVEGNLSSETLAFGGLPGDIPLTGDWNGDGRLKVGVYRSPGTWLLDYNGNGQWDGPEDDRLFFFGGEKDDVPVVGDWNGDGTSKAGVFREGFQWILDSNGNQRFDTNTKMPDKVFSFGGSPGDAPVVGDWNGDGKSKPAIYRHGLWMVDYNGDGKYRVIAFGGIAGDVPVAGDWNGDGRSKVGVFRKGFLWVLDINGNSVFEQGIDPVHAFGGLPGDVPVPGAW